MGTINSVWYAFIATSLNAFQMSTMTTEMIVKSVKKLQFWLEFIIVHLAKLQGHG